MKFCIIALPRSRSSILLETIGLKFNIKILGEDIGELDDRWGEQYADKFKLLLDKNLKESAGVFRFHPLQLAYVGVQKLTVLNFDWFNFKQYNKIFFTYRKSISDNIASNLVAEKFNKFTYKSTEELIKNIEPFYFCEIKDLFYVTDHINSIKIMKKLQKYFELHNIKYKNLDYDDIPEYISKNFPYVETYHIETKYDYRKIILNYDKILEVYNQKCNDNCIKISYSNNI